MKKRIINSVAPIRICDLGGWTDTWFADKGTILNIGVYPYAEVQIWARDADHNGEHRITINAENFGDRYDINPQDIVYDRHPLLEAAVSAMELPEGMSFEVSIFSEAPAGASTGTSAAVTVATLGALDVLTPGRRTPHEIAALAHHVETKLLGLQCGIQDQLCSAYGGVCFIEMHSYPRASVSQVYVPNSVWWELERRLVLIYLGNAHASSQVHGQVIGRLESREADLSVLEPLREAAFRGKDALFAGDFEGLGRAMDLNTEAQAALHPALISEPARRIMELGRSFGALGGKVNGAGGDGGSVTLLFGPEGIKKRDFMRRLGVCEPQAQIIPTYLSRIGLRTWESSPAAQESPPK